MEVGKKYELRKRKVPYYYEDVITRNPGVSLKMFEIFNGEEVRWGIREEYISITDKKYCASTPLFENVVDEKGFDRERIIYLKDSNFVIHGKLNNSEILGRIDSSAMLEQRFFGYQDFGGNDIKISDEENKKVRIMFKNNGYDRQFYFDCEKFTKYGNVFDIIYVNSFFIKSYEIDNKVKVFLGKLNTTNGMIYPVGYDIVNEKYFDFPLDKEGFINEYEMVTMLSRDKSNRGLNIDFYKGLNKDSLILMLFALDVEGFKVCEVLDNQVRCKLKRK